MNTNTAFTNPFIHFTTEIIANPDHPDIHAIYALGSAFFSTDGVFETEERFRECLANNINTALQNAYGPSHEVWLILKDAGKIIAAHNMMIISTPNGALELCDGFAWWIYMFIDPAYRKTGVATYFKDLIDCYTKDYLSAANHRPCQNFILLCEQNDPLHMTPAEFIHDKAISGIDPFDRLMMAQAQVGFRRYAGHYTQPPLKGNNEACGHLMLQIAPQNLVQVTGNQLKKAISTFFAISVMGDNPINNGIAKQVIDTIDADHIIELHDDREFLKQAKQQTVCLFSMLEQEGILLSTKKILTELLKDYQSRLPAFE